MRILALGVLAAPLVACAASSEPPAAPADQPPVENAGECDAAPAQYHIGHDATEAMGAAILKESGARTLRWGSPNSAWTMDYRPDRVNVKYDEARKITEITCG
ncbi:I78 family peptidase inhibitor [Qipengyuania qiaonensis]|uniref:Peptidase inhibitor I78 n=1 Tax=Qipengyuania qiaonensis TaxID=2867240 RepID=A0ABS7JBS8_9SPHN|nr:I78 family peptidase inhibitor [Qipengyuania qiaonensis]MBX7483420.1 hypothetical protein [Qipengyuania qiaonensis]